MICCSEIKPKCEKKFTCYVKFGPTSNENCLIHINGSALEKVDYCKFLVLIVDHKMNWIEHVNCIYNRLLKFVGMFCKLRYKLPASVLRDIYFAFVYPNLIYGIELYGNTSYSYLDKLLKLNNKLLTIVQDKKTQSCQRLICVL